jgi:hypothetical protein
LPLPLRIRQAAACGLCKMGGGACNGLRYKSVPRDARGQAPGRRWRPPRRQAV